MFDNLLIAASFVVDPFNFFIICSGVVLGIIIGALPGLGTAAGVAIMLPITLSLTPAQAIVMLGAIYAAGTAGGSITSILFRIPGEAQSAMTMLDGFPMAKRGEAGRALGISMTASAIGGVFSAIVLMFAAPILAQWALRFGQAEYFALALFGMSTVTSLAAKSVVKGLISTMIGLFLCTIGMSDVFGVERFTFGNDDLRYGISYIPVIVGIFGMSEFLRNAGTVVVKQHQIEGDAVKTQFGVIKEFLHMKVLMIRSVIIGTVIGVLPGTGGTTGSVIAYNEAVRWSDHPEKFGTGIDEGIAAPEFANNAACGGALVPTLTLGIPGSSTTAVILAALMSHGLTPGPNLFVQNKEMVWGVFGGYLMANVLMIFAGLWGIWMFAKILRVPRAILNWVIFILCVVGSFGINSNLQDVWIMFGFGLLGYLLEKFEYPLVPLVLAIILGPIAEAALIKGVMVYGSFWPFLTRPIGGTLLFLSVLSMLFPIFRNYLAKIKKAKAA